MAEYIAKELFDNAITESLRGICKVCAKYEQCVERGISRKGSHSYCWKMAHIPTVDAATVVHGYWYEVYEGPYGTTACAECSKCDENFVLGDYTLDEFKEYFKYCPNCGAKMDGGQKDGV